MNIDQQREPYTMQCSGGATAPVLKLEFSIASDKLAIEFAQRQSKIITSQNYYRFALLHEERGLLALWTVKTELEVHDEDIAGRAR